jgi:hypothetical protein
MMAQHNGAQRYMKLREELQVTEINKRGKKFDLKISLLKRKVHSKHAMKSQRGRRGIFILFLSPRCQMKVGGQRHAPAPLTP